MSADNSPLSCRTRTGATWSRFRAIVADKRCAMRYVTVLLVSALFLSLGAVSWADEIPLTTTPVAPAGEGKVSFEHDRNKNTRFTIHTKHLARPDSLTPAKTDYVVWVQPRGKDPLNAG